MGSLIATPVIEIIGGYKVCKLIKTQRLAGWLMYNGFILLRTDKDRTNPKFDIFVFRADEGIENEIDNYVKLHNYK